MTIEGIPEGWEAVEFDYSVFGDNWIDEVGDIHFHETDTPSRYKRLIIRKKPPKPKQYRPFANAAEFEPHRDRWIKRASEVEPDRKGCFRVSAFDGRGFWSGEGIAVTYQEAFDEGRQFDDGTPFGIEVTE